MHGRTSARPLADGEHVTLDDAGAKADDIAVAPHLGTDGFAGKHRSGKSAAERNQAPSGS